MRTPRGHVRRRPFGYEIAVPEGRDPITKRYQYRYEYAHSEEEAEEARKRMVADVVAGRAPRVTAKFGQLLDDVLDVIDLDFSTLGMYQGYIARTIGPALAEYDVRHLEQHPELLDKLYSQLRKCRRLCGGRRGLIDRRSAGRGKRLPDGTPDHECDARCRPHECRGAEPATIAQVHAIIKGFLGYAVRWKWIDENPAAHASPPEVTAEHDDPPSPEEAVLLLAAAEDHSPVMAMIVWLALVTGARRGELCALRWPDLNEAEGDLLIGGSYAVRKGHREVKATKTHRKRRLALDPGTIELLVAYREDCRKVALAAGSELDEDGFMFCADGLGQVPWNPDTVGKWLRQVAAVAGVSTTLHGWRHYSATQMLSGGIDLRTAAGRLGHSGGGTVTLRVYAHRTRPADQRAAELLAEQLRGIKPGTGAAKGRPPVRTAASCPPLQPAAAARLLHASAKADMGLGAFIRLALVAGARRAELLGVRWSYLRLEVGSLMIACRDGGKTARARRTIALDQVTMDALDAWRATRRSAAEAKGIAFDEDGYVFGPELLRMPWPGEAMTCRVIRIAAQTGISATVADLRRYSMGRLSVLGVGLDVVSYRLGLPAGSGMIPLFASAESLISADQEAARRLGRELDQALSAVESGSGQDG